ncbi:MAG: uracil-DNA glycosylase [Deltaproteobacteria bacterium]|nr:uracil-DNA glycosylase [Deltaproteobacteria bacterium]
MAETDSQPDCLHCEHYAVTWDFDKPRSCHAYEFKSHDLPSQVVLESSGQPCNLFRRKPGPTEPTKLLRRR